MFHKRNVRIFLLATMAACIGVEPVLAAGAERYAQSGPPTTQPDQRAPQQQRPAIFPAQRPTARQEPDNRRWDWNSYTPGVVPPLWNKYRNTFNLRLFQRNEHALRRYHGPSYVPPPTWRYRTWVYGQILPSIYWTRTYWISDYWLFGLMDPPYGYVWVRFGPDAILVDVRSGIILRVVYGAFFF